MSMYIKNDVMRFDNLSTDKYRQLKIRLLEKDFKVKLSQDQLSYFDTLQSDREIERYFFAIIEQAFSRRTI